MKTQRQNTFETNSSSTHSVTIQTKGTKGDKPLPSLVSEAGVLIPKNLSAYTQSFGESSFLVCDTKDKKAAIVLGWVNDAVEYESTGKDGEKIIEQVKQILTELCGYTGYDSSGYFSYSPSSEYDGNADDDYRDDLLDGNYDSFRKFVKDVILDDTKEICDNNESY